MKTTPMVNILLKYNFKTLPSKQLILFYQNIFIVQWGAEAPLRVSAELERSSSKPDSTAHGTKNIFFFDSEDSEGAKFEITA